MKPGQSPMFVFSTFEKMASQLMQQNFAMAPDQALVQFLSILPDSEYEIQKRAFSNELHLDREQVLLVIRTRYENLQRQRRKSGARWDIGHAFFTVAENETFGGKSNYPSGCCGRRRGMGRGKDRGRDRGGRKQGSDGDKRDGTKDGSLKCKCCGDDGQKSVRYPGQPCGIRGGKGDAAEICANVVLVLAYQAPGDDKTLSGGKKEAVICEVSPKLSGPPVARGGLGNTGCALDWQVGDISIICDNKGTCHMPYSSTGRINYREAKTFMKTASGSKYPINGYEDLSATFRSGRGEVPLSCFLMLRMYLASATTFSL